LSIEAGVKNQFLNGMLSANVTVYRIINNNLAQTAPYLLDGKTNSNTNIKMLSGKTTSDGAGKGVEHYQYIQLCSS
jgi:iron complex outermembrane receptor protein